MRIIRVSYPFLTIKSIEKSSIKKIKKTLRVTGTEPLKSSYYIIRIELLIELLIQQLFTNRYNILNCKSILFHNTRSWSRSTKSMNPYNRTSISHVTLPTEWRSHFYCYSFFHIWK